MAFHWFLALFQARVGSVVALAALLDGSRQFLAAADDRFVLIDPGNTS